ncbi:MAG: hypothetical protein II842_16705 [Butyrivibrio sp.]|nr:hypothetical protein [Butyrivibrio sp.]
MKEITKEFRLLPEEAVVCRDNKVGDGANPIGLKNNELILTNQALIHVKKDLFGKTKEVIRYPLADICMSQGKPQVLLGKGDNVTGSVDVFLQYETVNFKFEWKTDAEEWIASITETVTGEKVERKSPFGDMGDFEDLMNMAESVTGTVKGLKKAFGIASTEAVACKCPSCGAPLSGVEDEVVICPFCGASTKLKDE